MSDPASTGPDGVGLFLNPSGQRRIAFQRNCGERFARLYLADGTEQASYMLAQQQVDLLVIDLERFDRSIDLQALGELIAQRGGAPVLLICPYLNGGWLSALMAFGPLDYAIGPLNDDAFGARISACLRAAPAAQGENVAATELRAMLAAMSRMQQALLEADDINKVAEQVCMALCSVPGVTQAALFHLKQRGDLQLEAQHASNGLNLARVLGRSDRLLQSPLRHVFPGLLAACSGELAFLDVLEKAEEPELTLALRRHGVEMVLGLPIRLACGGMPSGSLCLMFDSQRLFSADELGAYADLAQLAGFGLRMAEMNRESESLLARLTHLATMDALTGVANRRRGEELLELEIKRARRYKVPLGLIVFDIDHFKAINDQYGHPVGDAALRTVADATMAALRTSDVLVRSGGEEFQIIVAHTSAIDALKLAEKLRVAIGQTDIAGCDRLTISLGVAQLADQESADSLVLRVNAALGRAKRAGRNCVELAMS
ncbi:MAG: GGDEF domain-containing protein [Pseudomonadota bacterium]